MILETERLILRAFQESDFEAVHAYGSDPEVVKYMRFGLNTLLSHLAGFAVSSAEQRDESMP